MISGIRPAAKTIYERIEVISNQGLRSLIVMSVSRCVFSSIRRLNKLNNCKGFHSSPVFLSAQSVSKRVTINDLRKLYEQKSKISVITAHDYITGKIADDAGVDVVLVGDSLAMVALGYEDTNEIPFDEFVYHCKAVSRGVKRSFIIADLPFGTYESSVSKAIESCVTLVSKGKAQAVKLEGGVEMAPTIEQLTNVGIPVVGHIGLTPQRANALGGFKVQGNKIESAQRVYDDALRLQDAGAFALLLEAIPEKLATYITANVKIPTIGIGAGPGTSAQVLVLADALGMSNGHAPKFVKKYSNFYEQGVEALQKYNNEVKKNTFPESGLHTYKIKDEIFDEFVRQVEDTSKK